jgi:hypothetical protein
MLNTIRTDQRIYNIIRLLETLDGRQSLMPPTPDNLYYLGVSRATYYRRIADFNNPERFNRWFMIYEATQEAADKRARRY